MGANVSDLPDGFVLDQAASPGLPDGFQIDSNGGATWGPGSNAASSFFLGAGPMIKAAAAATKESLSGGLPWGNAYDQALSMYRGAQKDWQTENPAANVATQVAGSAPLMLAGGAAPEGLGMLSNMGRAAATGAGYGGATGFIGGEGGFINRAENAAEQAALGGAFGAASVPVAKGLSAAWNAGVSPLINRAAVAMNSDKYAPTIAMDMIQKRIAADAAAGGPSAQQIADTIAANPTKPMSILDAGGTNVQGYGGKLARSPGASAQIIQDALNSRDVGAGQRILDDVGGMISNGQDLFTTQQQLTAARAAKAAPLYDAAFAANPVVTSPDIEAVLSTPAGKSALNQAATKMQNDMAAMGRADLNLSSQAAAAARRGQMEPIEGGVAAGLNMRSLDYVKRALDDQIGTAQRAGENDNVRVLSGLKNRLVTALDRADATAQSGQPGLYAQARSAFSSASASKDAADLGSQIFNTSPAETRQNISSLAPGDKDFFLLGAADAIRNRIASTSSGGNEALKLVGNDLLQQKLAPLFERPQDFQDFLSRIQAESQMFKTRQTVLGNSATAARQAFDNEDHGSGVMGPVMGAVASGHPGTGVAIAASKMLSPMLSWFSSDNPAVRAEAARILTQQGPAANQANLAALMAPRPNTTPYLAAPINAAGAATSPSILDYLTGR
jgi:hypothetical protein